MAKSNTSAEKMALDGSNESQDSEQVLIAYQQVYGVGLVRVIVQCAVRHYSLPIC
jgi:hypothetical protein